MLATLLAPVTRRLVYPSGETRIAATETDYALTVAGAELRGWVVNPGQARALVYFGGNGEPLDWLRPVLADRFPAHTSYLIAYRGYGASGGRPSQAALTADALALVDHAAERHPDAPVDVIGRSLGSGVAMQVAARRPIERLVLVTPFDSLAGAAADLFPRLPMRRLVADAWDSTAVAARVSARILVLRAGRDELVRPPRTDALLRSLRPDTRVVDLPEADHADIAADPASWRAVEDFLSR
ncbi:alpha/beta hydrolase [Nocardioides sp. MAH-18]|uniref:Alpha/beta hydrolase n=1 Tax=Nocardioides agri TaxID=2682843 RepID=A0A6L6XLV5_9ACTN|nr:alpha/beta hydrolase [Nocardioides sp. CGMCC 1.13656]MBA2953373.1 alpha/beta fold hydrolase [Nocardioides sp. CGMCC 1.13656]MVQ48241.1 alpha/beta hydrolase [Nocardioides sp. MAH-18]